MTTPLTVPLAGGVAAVYSCAAPEHGAPNEDAAALIPFREHSAVFVVADGMGGAPAGEVAAATAVRAIGSALMAVEGTDETVREAILTGFETANEQVMAMGVGAATTLSVVVLEEGTARPFHVGDSEILITGQRGKIKWHTVSHSPVAYAVEAGFLDRDEALNHDDRNIILNMIGSTAMRIDVGPPIVLAPRDTLVLGSDGLFDNLRIDEIVEFLRAGPLDRSTAALVAECRRRMTEAPDGEPSKLDDLTLISWRRRAPSGAPSS